MQLNIRLATAGLALIFASATAQGFQLEPKGPAAKWRTDVVKRSNKYTACVLKAWNKCEIAAAKTELKLEDDAIELAEDACTGPGTPNAECVGEGEITADAAYLLRDGIGVGSLVDCQVGNTPIDAAGGSVVEGEDITALNTTVLTKCEPILALADESPTKPKGLNAANKLGMSLADIGCFGDCDDTQDGAQACASIADWKTNAIDPDNNARKTAADIADIIAFAQTTGPVVAPLACGAAWPDPTGVDVNAGTTAVVKYTEKVGACVQKCQDDLVGGAEGKGNGFRDDTTNCILNAAGDGALFPGGDGAPFDACVSAAYAATLGDSELASLPGWACLQGFLTAPAIGLGPIGSLIAGQISDATNESYDRVDIEAAAAADVVGLVLPSQAPSLAARAAPNQRVAYGTCASFNDTVLEDYEECEPFGLSACADIPGTAANLGGNAACTGLHNPFYCCSAANAGTCSLCPAGDNAASKQIAGRCPRP
jgi:hypothetical protein